MPTPVRRSGTVPASQRTHRFRLRQVHLIHAELFDQLALAGRTVGPGDLGENATTRGIDLLARPVETRVPIGDAVVAVTGLRNPCRQMNDFQPGLLKQLLRIGCARATGTAGRGHGWCVARSIVRPGD